MNEQLTVKNFGPIKDATVDFKRVTVFIGPTGGGKSTLAKLAAIFRDVKFYHEPLSDLNNNYFNQYSIDKYFKKDDFISWTYKENSLYVQEKVISFNKNLTKYFNNFNNRIIDEEIEKIGKIILEVAKNNELTYNQYRETDEFKKLFSILYKDKVLKEIYRTLISTSTPTYIPSERIFISSIEYSWAGLLRDDIGIPKQILNFANIFSLSRKDIFEFEIPFLDVKYIHENEQDFIKIPQSETLFRLYETASGIQSVTPMLVLLEHLSRQKEQAQSFIIEEPELNLYPTVQQGLMNWLIEKCTKGENDLTITTHSPYILSHLNLLLFAYQVAENHPDRADDVAKVVPRESWINPKEFACYHVEGQKENGVHSIVNPETGLISYNDLDALAGNSATEFDQLLDINAGLEVE